MNTHRIGPGIGPRIAPEISPGIGPEIGLRIAPGIGSSRPNPFDRRKAAANKCPYPFQPAPHMQIES